MLFAAQGPQAQESVVSSEFGTSSSYDMPGANFTQYRDINPNGAIVGFGATRGLLRNAAGAIKVNDVPISTRPTFGTQLRAITDSGDILGWCMTLVCKCRGFVLNKHGFTDFDFPGGSSLEADGINSDGDIVDGYIDATSQHHAFLLKQGDSPSASAARTH